MSTKTSPRRTARRHAAKVRKLAPSQLCAQCGNPTHSYDCYTICRGAA